MCCQLHTTDLGGSAGSVIWSAVLRRAVIQLLTNANAPNVLSIAYNRDVTFTVTSVDPNSVIHQPVPDSPRCTSEDM